MHRGNSTNVGSEPWSVTAESQNARCCRPAAIGATDDEGPRPHPVKEPLPELSATTVECLFWRSNGNLRTPLYDFYHIDLDHSQSVNLASTCSGHP
jgi:hypothetical protein